MTDPDLTPEAVERLKAEVMTLEHNGGLWVTAEDYAALSAALEAEKARADLCTPTDERVKELEAENARLREALSLYSCDDGCNDCPEHERDQVGCGWTARAALRDTDETP